MYNIAIVANTSFNIVNFRLPLMHFLKENNFNVIAIAPQDDYSETIISNGFKFIPIKKLTRKGTNPIQDLQLLIELRKIYKQEKIDVALQYTIKPNIYGSLATLFSKTKTICTVTGLGYTFLNKSIASSISKLLYKIAFLRSNLVFFQNQEDANLFAQKRLVNNNKTKIINGSGIDVEYFHPSFCKQNELENSLVRFLFIGRLLKDKGIYEYIGAAQKIIEKYNNTTFTIVGDFDENNPSGIQKEKLTSTLITDKIIYQGYVKDTRNIICASDCVVLPSYREGLPRVLLEAMAMQKPCIATNVAGCKDAVDEQCALFADVADTTSLYKAMEKYILLDNTTKIEMGKHARQRAESRFSVQLIAKNYLAEILILINKHS